MKKQLLIILLLAFSPLLIAQKKPKIKGNKQVVDITKAIENDFSTIEIMDDLDIEIQQGFSNIASLKADQNLVDVIKFVVIDSVLKVSTTHKIKSKKKMEINLTIKSIEKITLRGSSKINGVGKIVSDSLLLVGYDSSRFNFDIETSHFQTMLYNNSGGRVTVKANKATIVLNDRTDLDAYLIAEEGNVILNKSSQLNFDGELEMVNFTLKETSELNAKKMKVSNAKLTTSNSSDVYIYASKNLELYAQGKSNIYIYGNPKMEVKGLAGKSKIIKR